LQLWNNITLLDFFRLFVGVIVLNHVKKCLAIAGLGLIAVIGLGLLMKAKKEEKQRCWF
jgi:hypothetical protein